MIYTGIGSRKTPQDIQQQMADFAAEMAKRGHILRSGKAEGADRAFQLGAQSIGPQAQCEIYIPWPGYSSHGLWNLWDVVVGGNPEAQDMVSQVHPAWHRCNDGARKLHARNAFQVLGPDLELPSDFVLYWAEEDTRGQPMGGTATAVKLAQAYGVPTINMRHPGWEQQVTHLLNQHAYVA